MNTSLFESHYMNNILKRNKLKGVFVETQNKSHNHLFYDVLTPIRRNEIFAFTKNRCGYYK